MTAVTANAWMKALPPWRVWSMPISLSLVLIAVAQHDFLTFHTLAELFAIIISFVMFAFAWTTHDFTKNTLLIFLACGYFWIGSLDLMHTFVYKGMNLFIEGNGNSASQFWIGTRYAEALLLLSAPLIAGREVNKYATITIFAIIAMCLSGFILAGYFPATFVEGSGLTPFKIYSEYAINGLLFLALVTLFRAGHGVTIEEKVLIGASIVMTMCAELSFTFYVDVYDFSNLTGHIFKLFSFWLLYYAIVIYNVKKPYAALIQARNALESKVEERTNALHKSDRMLADAIEGIPDMISLYDSEDCFVLSNKKYREVLRDVNDMLVPGTTLADILRVSCERGLVEGFQDKPEEWVQIRLSRLHTPHEPVLHQQRDGRWALTSDHKTSDGGTLIYRTDVTELMKTQKQLQTALEKSEGATKAKSALLSNMSHELRTPLNAIIGFSEAMKSEIFGPIENNKYLEYLNDIHHSGQHLLELINDILDVSAIEADALKLNEDDISLSEVVEGSIQMLRPRAAHGQVTLTAALGPKTPLLYADGRRVKQVLLNLISNAVKFSHKGGDVTVGVQVNEDGSLALSVSDSGIGMDDKEMITALSSFGQVDTGLDRKHEGTGLGLPLTQGLMELHGGTLDIKSEKNHGTLITATFPKERVVWHVN